jgi:vacuolar-type H+-ATPase subunit H
MTPQSKPLLGDGGEWILNTIKRNPEGLLLLAAGAVLMMRTSSPEPFPPASVDRVYRETRSASDEMASQMTDAVKDTARRTMDAASSYASTASETARQTMDAAKSYASSATDYADQARRKVGEQSDRIVQQTRSMAQSVLQNQPLAIVAAGLAAGAALAAAFPPTELERETLGPVGNEVSNAAERFGDQVKQATAKAGEKLKDAAEERGLHTEGLKDMAGEVVDTFKASMAGRTDPTGDSNVAARPDSGRRNG